MAEENSQSPSAEGLADSARQDARPPGTDQDVLESDVDAAAEAVRRAKEQLRGAQQSYRQLRRQTVDQLKQLRQMSVGELVDTTLHQVRKHPGPGVVIAAMIGFFLGRLFRR